MRLKNKDGFTLTELLVVVAIVGIMAVAAIPAILSWLPNMRLKAAARDLYSNMQGARMVAIKTNKNTAIIFKPATNTYDMCDDWNSTAVPPCAVPVRSISLAGYKSGVGYGHGNAAQSLPGGAFPAGDVSYNPPANTVVFTPQGLGTKGYVYLSNNQKTTYAIGSQTSGVIQLKRWQGANWK